VIGPSVFGEITAATSTTVITSLTGGGSTGAHTSVLPNMSNQSP